MIALGPKDIDGEDIEETGGGILAAASAAKPNPAAEKPKEPVATPDNRSLKPTTNSDDIGREIKDVYRTYLLVKLCESAGVPGKSATALKPVLRQMDDAGKRLGLDTEKLWQVATSSNSEDGDLNTFLMLGQIIVPPYEVGGDRASADDFCFRAKNMVAIGARQVVGAASPDADGAVSNLLSKDF